MLLLAALLILGWSLTCLVEVSQPALLAGLIAAAAATTPLVAVFAVAICAFALRSRHGAAGGIAITAGLLPWIFALPYAVPAETGSTSATTIRVLLVNARDGRADPRDMVGAARAHSVDLLVVTELTSRLAHDLTISGIDGRLLARWVSVPPVVDRRRAGLGIWSRSPMSDFTPIPGTHWPAVRASWTPAAAPDRGGRARRPTDPDLVRVVERPTWPRCTRPATCAGPVTVLGDLNGTPWNPQFRSAAGGGLHDAGDVLGRGVRPTWPSWLGGPAAAAGPRPGRRQGRRAVADGRARSTEPIIGPCCVTARLAPILRPSRTLLADPAAGSSLRRLTARNSRSPVAAASATADVVPCVVVRGEPLDHLRSFARLRPARRTASGHRPCRARGPGAARPPGRPRAERPG